MTIESTPSEAFKPFTRGDVTPIRHGWYERKYPAIAGAVAHPCPFDFWNGKQWMPGVPDNASLYRVKRTGLGIRHGTIPCKEQNLPWRRASVVRIETAAELIKK